MGHRCFGCQNRRRSGPAPAPVRFCDFFDRSLGGPAQSRQKTGIRSETIDLRKIIRVAKKSNSNRAKYPEAAIQTHLCGDMLSTVQMSFHSNDCSHRAVDTDCIRMHQSLGDDDDLQSICYSYLILLQCRLQHPSRGGKSFSRLDRCTGPSRRHYGLFDASSVTPHQLIHHLILLDVQVVRDGRDDGPEDPSGPIDEFDIGLFHVHHLSPSVGAWLVVLGYTHQVAICLSNPDLTPSGNHIQDLTISTTLPAFAHQFLSCPTLHPRTARDNFSSYGTLDHLLSCPSQFAVIHTTYPCSETTQ